MLMYIYAVREVYADGKQLPIPHICILFCCDNINAHSHLHICVGCDIHQGHMLSAHVYAVTCIKSFCKHSQGHS